MGSPSRRKTWRSGEVEYNFTRTAFPVEEAPGASVFYRSPAGEIFHTYSTYGRGLDGLIGTYNFLDLAPKGRDEDGLDFTMAWVRHHDRYEDQPGADQASPAHAPCCSGTAA